MPQSLLQVPPQDTVAAWLLSPIEETPYPGEASPAEDRVQYRFINGFVDVGELPCRRAWRAALPGRVITPPPDFDAVGVHLPGLNRRVEFTGFWHTPTHLARWCRTRLVPAVAGPHSFVLGTCGGVRIWVDGVLCVKFEPYQRNSEQRLAIELPLRAEGSEVLMLCEELAERDTLWYVELLNSHNEALAVELPLAVSSEQLEALRLWALGARPAHDVFVGEPLEVAFDRPAPPGLTLSVVLRRNSHDVRWQHWLARDVVLLPDALSWVAPAGEAVPDGFHQVTLVCVLGAARLERRLDAAFMATLQVAPAPAALAQRKREALIHLATHGEHRVGRALALLECGLHRSHEAELSELIHTALRAIERREDCADFVMVPMLWIWSAHHENLPLAVATRVRQAILGWRYWVDEPGNDAMWFWSENHALCFHAAQWLAAKNFPDELFSASGRTGRGQGLLASARLTRWFDAVEAHGLAEWNSAAYYPVDFIGLLALQRWADAPLAARATGLLDRLFEMVALHTLGGVPAGSMGRAYDKELKAGPLTELAPFCRVAWGQGWLNGGVASLPMFAAGSYAPPAHLQAWLSPGAGSAIDARYVQGYQPARLVVHKTAAVQLSSVVDGEPGQAGHQQHMLDVRFADHPFARAWINHPGEDDPHGHQRPSFWAGNGRMPRVAQHGDTALMLYDLGDAPRLPYTHAYVARDAFDEVVLRGPWLFLRNGAGYAALGGSAALQAIASGPTSGHEYRLPGARSAWVVRVASGAGGEAFTAFQSQTERLSLSFRPDTMTLNVTAPGRPNLSLDWTHGLSVGGQPQPFGADTVTPQITVTTVTTDLALPTPAR